MDVFATLLIKLIVIIVTITFARTYRDINNSFRSIAMLNSIALITFSCNGDRIEPRVFVELQIV